MKKFPDANLAFVTGSKSKITVVDIDDNDPSLFQEALRIFGDTPVTVHTGSGKFHAYYRFNGEKRRIRPFDDLPIDILGESGICIAPPSKRPDQGNYVFLDGGIEFFDALPTLAPGSLPGPKQQLDEHLGSQFSPDKYPEGQRETALFKEARRLALRIDDFEEFAGALMKFSSDYLSPPLETNIVLNKADHVWKLKLKNRCYYPDDGRSYALIDRDDGCQLYSYPPALVLWHFLICHHRPSDRFSVSSRGLATILPFSRPTIRKALDYLIELGFLDQIHPGGKFEGDASSYKFSSRI